MFSINSECPLSANCSTSRRSVRVKPESFSGFSSSISGDLCFLLWKIGIIPEEKPSEKSIQLEFFEAFTAFLKSIFLRAYFNCILFGLLFQPPLDRIHENNVNNSMRSCENLCVNRYSKGFSFRENISFAMLMVDFMVATKPTRNVFSCE